MKFQVTLQFAITAADLRELASDLGADPRDKQAAIEAVTKHATEQAVRGVTEALDAPSWAWTVEPVTPKAKPPK
jgi:hypothetical protein